LQLGLHVGESLRSAGAVVKPTQSGFGGVTLAWDNRVVSMVEQKVEAGVAGATSNIGELGLAEANAFVESSELVAEADFAETVKTVANVGSNAGGAQAVDYERVSALVDFEIGAAGGTMRRDEPLAGGSERLVELRRDAIGVAKEQVGAKFRAIASYVEQSEACGLSKSDIERLGAVNFRRELKKRRGVTFFLHGDEQAGLSVFLDLRVADGVKFSDAG